METLITKFFKSAFALKKVKKDLFEYLQEQRAEFFNGEEYVFEISEIDNPDELKKVKISERDLLTIFRYKSDYRFDEDLYYYITVAIGEFKGRDEHGFYTIEKCQAELRYNYDYSCYDIEFSFSYMTEEDDGISDLGGTLNHFVAMMNANSKELNPEEINNMLKISISIEGEDYLADLRKDIEGELSFNLKEYGLNNEKLHLIKQMIKNYKQN